MTFVRLKNEFLRNASTFLQNHPIKMPGNPRDGGSGNYVGSFYPLNVRIGKEPREIMHGVDFEPKVTKATWYLNEDGAAELIIAGSDRFQSVSQATGGIPGTAWFDIYFLPWKQGNITRMQIPVQSKVKHFFTGEMNGCAFLVSGFDMNPLVAHLNVLTPEENQPVFWPYERHIKLEKMINQTLRGNSKQKAKILTKWGPHATSGTSAGKLIQAGADYTYMLQQSEENDASDIFDQYLNQSNLERDLTHPLGIIADIRCATMGVLTNTKWSFYYQRMVCINTMTKKQMTWLQSFKKSITFKKYYTDPRQSTLVKRYITIPGEHFVRLR